MRRLPTMLLALTAVGCLSSSDSFKLGPTDSNVTGTFQLAAANGQPVPFIASVTPTEEWDVTADTMIINTDNSWRETTNYRVTQLGDGTQKVQADTTAGTYSIANEQINFVTVTGGTSTFVGSVSGDALTVLFNNSQFVYLR
jgi:hypothetical protein